MLITELSRNVIEHTKRPKSVAVRSDQRRSRIESDVRFGCYGRVVCKATVGGCIRNDKEMPLHNRVRAKRNIARSLGDLKSDFRFEPLAVGIDQA